MWNYRRRRMVRKAQPLRADRLPAEEVDETQEVSLDRATITKLAVAIATAEALQRDGEAIGPLTRMVWDTLEQLEAHGHFREYYPGGG